MIFKRYITIAGLPNSVREFWSSQEDISYFSSYKFYFAYESCVLTLEEKKNICVVVFFNDEQPIVIMPLLVKSRFGARNYGALSNYYFPSYQIIMPPDLRNNIEFIDSVILGLLTFIDSVDCVDLLPLYENNLFWSRFGDLVSENPQWSVQFYDHSVNWTQTIKDLETYINERPEKLKNTLRRRDKKLESIDHKYFVYKTTEKVEEALNSYWEVYKHSWKVMEPYPEFIDSLVSDWAKKGSLRLGILYIEGSPVSCQLWLVEKQRANIFKLAYDPKYSKYSIGSLLTRFMIQRVVEDDQVKLIDFLNGNDAFKRDWMSDSQKVYGIHLLNKKRFYGYAMHLYTMVRAQFKRVMKPEDN